MILPRFFLTTALSATLALPLLAQTPATVRKHLVYFRDKAGTPYSVAQPEAFLSARAIARRVRQRIAVQPRDLPVSPAYVQQVKAVAGTQLWYTSRWFNAAIVACDSATLQRVQALPCVRAAQTLNRGLPGAGRPKTDDPEGPAEPTGRSQTARPQYGKAYAQAQMVGAVQMHEAGFRGEGMQIAVFDGGFSGVNTAAPFRAISQENRLAGVFNVVDKTGDVFSRDDHGTHCLSAIGASEAGLYLGTAPRATFRLYLTEEVRDARGIPTEHPIEEANWLIAAEKADSAGVDIISSSLGYSTFDFPSVDYSYASMNGRTAISTRAATVAARVGMLVVSSAGNEGNGSWRYITAPADADSILTVGATDSLAVVAGFSSRGPTADGRIKPNLAAMGVQTAIVSPGGSVRTGNGTSYSCPVLAGMAAGFWQANPTLTAQQVIGFLQRSGTRALTPNDEVGYGIPHFVRAYNLANPGTPLAAAPPAPRQDLLIYPNPSKDDELYLQLAVDFQATPLQVRIYDARGALVSEQQIAPTTAVAVRLKPGVLTKGVYTCTVSNRREQRTVRFVKL